MNAEYRRDPERILAEVQRDEQRLRKGRLKVFLGYASGVGKSARMFGEGSRRRQRGEDVVVGGRQAEGDSKSDSLWLGLETIPTLKVDGGERLDIVKILRRRPQVVLIDGLAHRNPPGSPHAERWQEIDELLQAGISVITSINLQYVAELRDEAASITGKRPLETVPLAFLERADDIEVVDAPALGPGTTRLREMALVTAAEVVEAELRAYLLAHRIVEDWGIQERILVGITPRSDARTILETGRRDADRFHGRLLAAYVRQARLSPADRTSLAKNLETARACGASVHVLEGRDPVRTLLDFARSRNVTQIFIGHSRRRGLWSRLRGNPVERLIALAGTVDIRVFPQRERP